MQIVEKDSAILQLPGEISGSLPANHHTICKFRSPTDTQYVRVRNTISYFAREATPNEGTVDHVCHLSKRDRLTPGQGPASNIWKIARRLPQFWAFTKLRKTTSNLDIAELCMGPATGSFENQISCSGKAHCPTEMRRFSGFLDYPRAAKRRCLVWWHITCKRKGRAVSIISSRPVIKQNELLHTACVPLLLSSLK